MSNPFSAPSSSSSQTPVRRTSLRNLVNGRSHTETASVDGSPNGSSQEEPSAATPLATSSSSPQTASAVLLERRNSLARRASFGASGGGGNGSLRRKSSTVVLPEESELPEDRKAEGQQQQRRSIAGSSGSVNREGSDVFGMMASSVARRGTGDYKNGGASGAFVKDSTVAAFGGGGGADAVERNREGRGSMSLEDFLVRRAKKQGAQTTSDFLKLLDPLSRSYFESYPEKLATLPFRQRGRRSTTNSQNAIPPQPVKTRAPSMDEERKKQLMAKFRVAGNMTKAAVMLNTGRFNRAPGMPNALSDLMKTAEVRSMRQTRFGKIESRVRPATSQGNNGDVSRPPLPPPDADDAELMAVSVAASDAPTAMTVVPSEAMDHFEVDEDELPGLMCQQRIEEANRAAALVTAEQIKGDEGAKIWGVVSIIRDVLLLLYIVYCTLTVSWRIALGSSTLEPWTHWVEATIDALAVPLFLIKVVLPVEDKGHLVTELAVVRKLYLTGWFRIDVIAMLPLQALLLPLHDAGKVGGLGEDLARVNRLLLLVRYSLLFDRTSDKLFAQIHPTAMRIVKFVLLCFMLGFVMAAPIYAVMRYDRDAANSWGMIGKLSSDEILNYEETYLMTIMILAGRSYPYPISEPQIIVMLFVAISGLMSSAIIIAGVSSMVVTLVERSSKLANKLDLVISTLSDMQQPTVYIEEVCQYYTYMHKVFQTFDYTDEATDELDELPEDLRLAIRDEINITTIKQIPLFHDVSDDAIFVKALATRLSVHLLVPGMTIVKEGEDGDEMFFLTRGRARVVINSIGADHPVAYLDEGDFFGEQAVLFNIPRSATVVAETLCRVFLLHGQDFEDLVEIRPQALETILQTAEERMQTNQAAKEEAHRLRIQRGAARIVNRVADIIVDRVTAFRARRRALRIAANLDPDGDGGADNGSIGGQIVDFIKTGIENLTAGDHSDGVDASPNPSEQMAMSERRDRQHQRTADEEVIMLTSVVESHLDGGMDAQPHQNMVSLDTEATSEDHLDVYQSTVVGTSTETARSAEEDHNHANKPMQRTETENSQPASAWVSVEPDRDGDDTLGALGGSSNRMVQSGSFDGSLTATEPFLKEGIDDGPSSS